MPVKRKKRADGTYYRDRWRVIVWSQGKPTERIHRGSKREALEAEHQLRRELAAAASQRRIAPRFSDFCVSEYADHGRANLSPATWRNRKYQIADLIDHLGDKRLTDITTADVEAFKTLRRRGGAGPGTVNDDLKVLGAILRHAVDLGIPAHVPKLRRYRTTQRRVRAWTAGQVMALYDSVREHSPDLLPIVVFLANTGCRKGEAIALRCENIDHRRGLIRIYPTELDAKDQWSPKTDKPREIPIAGCLRPHLPLGAKGYAFPRSDGAAYQSWPQRKFDRARKAAELEGGPHTLRHTYASHFLAAQPDLYLLSQILGHSYQRTTTLYAHLLPDHLERARDAVSIAPALTLVPESESNDGER